jgi:hypothetical protein
MRKNIVPARRARRHRRRLSLPAICLLQARAPEEGDGTITREEWHRGRSAPLVHVVARHQDVAA